VGDLVRRHSGVDVEPQGIGGTRGHAAIGVGRLGQRLDELIVAVTRYVSLGSIIGSLTVPLLFWYFGYDLAYILFGLAMAILVTARHHANIKRLLTGTESKLGRKA
jgi:glycerol-3-phosphate acyltransferase PlsY